MPVATVLRDGRPYLLQDVLKHATRKSIPANFLSAEPKSVRELVTVSNGVALAAVDPDDGAWWSGIPRDRHGRPIILRSGDDWARLCDAMMLLAGTEPGLSSDLVVSMGIVPGDNFHVSTVPALGFSVRYTGGGRRVLAIFRSNTGVWTHNVVIANAACRGALGVITQYGADTGLAVASEVEAAGKKSTAGSVRQSATTPGVDFTLQPHVWYAIHTLATTATGSLQIDDWGDIALGGVG